MGFLDTNFDLVGTRYSAADLDSARRFLCSLIRRADASWTSCPTGGLSLHWNSTTTPSAVELIDIASALFTVSKKLEGADSEKFVAKVLQLLRVGGDQYEEVKAELYIGAALSTLAAQLELEPPTINNNTGTDRRKNTDYAVKFPTEDVSQYVEVTALHIGRLQNWSEAINAVVNRFQKEVSRRCVHINLEIAATIGVSRRSLSDRDIAKLCTTIAQSKDGSVKLSVGSGEVHLRWSPAPHYAALEAVHQSGSPTLAASVGRGVEIRTFAACRRKLLWTDEASAQLFRSLQNVFDAKLDQFRVPAPYLIVIKPSDLIDRRRLATLISSRFFKNPKYRRISAVALLSLSFSQDTGIRSKTALLINSAATAPLSPKFRESLSF